MNRHFTDTRYYLKRAVETAMAGVRAELEPVEQRVRAVTGREQAASRRLNGVKADLREVGGKAEGEAKGAISGARRRVEAYRKTEA